MAVKMDREGRKEGRECVFNHLHCIVTIKFMLIYLWPLIKHLSVIGYREKKL